MMHILRYTALLGYAICSVLILQIIALGLLSTLQYTVFNQAALPNGDGVWYESIVTYKSSQPAPSDTDDFLSQLRPFAWLLVAAIGLLLVLYAGNVTSALLKKLVKMTSGRITIGNLFAAKFILVGILHVSLALFAIILPMITLIIPVYTSIALVAYACFGVQLYLVHRCKIPVKNVL